MSKLLSKLLKPSFVPLIAAFLLFGSPDAPGTHRRRLARSSFMNMQAAWA